MRSRRGATDLAGILPIDKPAGMTSHDVVAAVRRSTGEGRVGHAGTLDPGATGLLVVLVGPYARLEPYLSGADKTYIARIAFGTETDTDDADGEVVREAPVPPSVLDPAETERALAGLVGESMQVPPAYSALKVDGRAAYRAARAGDAMDLAERRIVVHEARLLGVDAEARAWDVAFRVSKGTYVRALARDLGRACGSAAHLTALRRTASGTLDIAAAHALEAVIAAGAEPAPLFAEPVAALGLRTVDAEADAVACGRALAAPDDAAEGERFAVLADGELAAVYSERDGRLVPAVVIGRAA